MAPTLNARPIATAIAVTVNFLMSISFEVYAG
jgi:hypothetical protein